MAAGWGWGWRPYVSVAERREQARCLMDKRRKKGLSVQPVVIEGRNIARTFWGQSWCKHLESFSDFENRLPRGCTYVRNGSVCHLEISSGVIKAIVSGSELYDVKVTIGKLRDAQWQSVKEQCSGKIGSLLELLQGKFSNNVMSVVTDRREGLFPLPGEIKMSCSCPDWAEMCKHVAATMYGVGARLDHQPELLFILRGVNHEELIAEKAVSLVADTKKSSSRKLSAEKLEDVFGIEFVDLKRIADKGGNGKSARLAERVEPLKSAKPMQPSDSVKRSRIQSPVPAIAPKARGNARQKPTGQVEQSRTSLTGKELKKLRSRLDITESQLAVLMGVSTAAVRNWESKSDPIDLKPSLASKLYGLATSTKQQTWAKLGKS